MSSDSIQIRLVICAFFNLSAKLAAAFLEEMVRKAEDRKRRKTHFQGQIDFPESLVFGLDCADLLVGHFRLLLDGKVQFLNVRCSHLLLLCLSAQSLLQILKLLGQSALKKRRSVLARFVCFLTSS